MIGFKAFRRNRFFLLTMIIFVQGSVLSAQVYPVDGASLSARLVPFQSKDVAKAVSYTFQVARGRYDDKQFAKHILTEKESSDSKEIIELPAYGEEYSWRVAHSEKPGKANSYGPVHHFRIVAQKRDSNTRFRVRVLENKYTDTGLVFFVDGTSGMFNLKGETLWQMPDTIAGIPQRSMPIDMKVTSFNSITFLADSKGYEIDYSGKLLWVSPPFANKGYLPEAYQYHHDFTRLRNGNYMLLSADLVEKVPPVGVRVDGFTDNRIDFGSLVEFDAAGKPVWSWRSSEYFTDEDIFSRKTVTGAVNPRSHLNSFYFDEDKKVVYLGFRDMNRIVKIKYPEKTLLASYNGQRKDAEKAVFLKQHNVHALAGGKLSLFSNRNGRVMQTPMGERFVSDNAADTIAEVVVIKETPEDEEGYKKVWAFSCDIDKEAPATSTRGGSVTELPDGCLFVFMGSSARIFIVNDKNEILYNAVLEEITPFEDSWRLSWQYRASPVTKKQLEALIYHILPLRNNS